MAKSRFFYSFSNCLSISSHKFENELKKMGFGTFKSHANSNAKKQYAVKTSPKIKSLSTILSRTNFFILLISLFK